MSDDVLTAALDYAARGWHVFPVRGKRPALDLAPRWSEASTTDPAVIASWYAGSTGLGVAVDLGPSSLIVLDVDHPAALPDTLPDLTGLAYRGNPDRVSSIYRGTVGQAVHPWGEVKAAGGYVVLPPSPHHGDKCAACTSGPHRYEWLEDVADPPVLPDDLAAAVAPKRPTVPAGEPWTPDQKATDADKEAALDHYAAWWQVVAETPPSGGRHGGRNRALYVASVVAGELCPHYLPTDTAAEQLVGAARACGLVDDDGLSAVQSTIRSGMRAGMKNPTAIPAEPLPPLVTADETARPYGSWSPVPLAVAATESTAAAVPTVLRVDGDPDGRGLFYPGRVSVVSGEPGHGKTWALIGAVADTTRAGGRVLILDLEDSGGTWWDRLAALGIDPDGHAITYTHPDQAIPATEVLDEIAADRDLVVVDGMTSLYELHGLSTDSDADTARVFRWLDRLAATGAAVVATDHVTKSTENRRYARGSSHKLAALTGAGYRLDPDPATGPPAPGLRSRGRLVVTKDRPGGLGVHAGSIAAMLDLDATRSPARLAIRPAPGRAGAAPLSVSAMGQR